MKPVDVNSNTYIDFNKENTQKDLKFEVGNRVKIFKYKNILQKVTFRIGLKKLLLLKRLKTL